MPFILYSIWHYVGFLRAVRKLLQGGRATAFPFWASEKFGREVAPPGFHFQSKSASHAEVAPLDFFFRTEIWFPRYRRGGRSGHVLFLGYKRQEHTSKMRETCEFTWPLITQLRHPSPLLLWDVCGMMTEKGNAVAWPPCNDFRAVRRNPT